MINKHYAYVCVYNFLYDVWTQVKKKISASFRTDKHSSIWWINSFAMIIMEKRKNCLSHYNITCYHLGTKIVCKVSSWLFGVRLQERKGRALTLCRSIKPHYTILLMVKEGVGVYVEYVLMKGNQKIRVFKSISIYYSAVNKNFSISCVNRILSFQSMLHNNFYKVID